MRKPRKHLRRRFQCRTQHDMWCNENFENNLDALFSFNAARSMICGATTVFSATMETFLRFNAARGFVGGALAFTLADQILDEVSMPHAALWVVQLDDGEIVNIPPSGFQCRTRLCGWCSADVQQSAQQNAAFQCRTRLCGWCSLEIYQLSTNPEKFQCRTRLCGWCS